MALILPWDERCDQTRYETAEGEQAEGRTRLAWSSQPACTASSSPTTATCTTCPGPPRNLYTPGAGTDKNLSARGVDEWTVDPIAAAQYARAPVDTMELIDLFCLLFAMAGAWAQASITGAGTA